MKIIEVISDTNIGGAGVLLLNRLSCTDMNKYSTLVLLPEKSRLCKRLRELGVEYREIECRGDRSLELGSIKRFKKIIAEEKPDIINTHGSLSARIAAWLCRVPVKICTRHCVFPLSMRERIFGGLNNMLSDCFIAVAYSAKENLVKLGVSAKKIRVIINGSRPLYKLDAASKKRLKGSLGINPNTAVLGFCARLEPCKGHEWFFKTVRALKCNGIDFKVLLLGDGTQRDILKALSDELEISDRIIFCGFKEDISPYMNIVDININCSVGTETSSLALSEGMSLGIPAVVSNYGGNSYMVKHGKNGFVCEVYDHMQMSRQIKYLLADKALYKKMSDAAIDRFENELNAQAMTEKTDRLYDELYRRRAARSKV